VAWLDRLEAEHDNLGAAISWFLDQDQPGPALQLGAMTWQYWWLRGHTEESARYGEVIVASGEKLPAAQLGYAQIGQGVLHILSGGKGRAQVLFEHALALFGRLGDKRGIAIATGYLGHLAALRGDDEKASKLLTESLASPQDLDDLPLAGIPQPTLGGWPWLPWTARRGADCLVMRGIDLGRGLAKRLARQRRFERPLS
jgi:hypothetical protein